MKGELGKLQRALMWLVNRPASSKPRSVDAARRRQEEILEEFADTFAGYKFLGTLDARTCLICGRWDGVIARRREDLPVLPLHPGCRCVIAPVTRFSDDAALTRPSIAKAELRLVRHRDGTTSRKQKIIEVKHVPASTTYKDFFISQPPDWQREVLGERLFEVWSSGTMDFERLCDLAEIENQSKHERGPTIGLQ